MLSIPSPPYQCNSVTQEATPSHRSKVSGPATLSQWLNEEDTPSPLSSWEYEA